MATSTLDGETAGERDGARSSRSGAVAVDAALVGAGMLTGLSMSGLTPVLPKLEAAFAAAPGVGFLGKLVVSVVGLAILCAAPLSTAAVRRFRADRVVIGAFALYAASAALGSVAADLYQLIATRFAQGLCVAIGVTTALGLISTLHEGPARDRRLGLHMGISALALTVLLPLCGLLGEWSWRLAPLVGLIGLVHAALATRGRRLLAGAAVSAPRRRAGGATARRAVVETAVLAFAIGVATYSPPAFLPFKLNALGLTSTWEISLFGTLMMVAAAGVGLLYGAFSARMSSRALFVGGFGLGAAGMLTVGVATSLPVLVLGLLVGGLGGGTLVPHVYGDCVTRFAPGERVRATGVIKSASCCGLFAGPLALQVVMNASSIAGVFIVLGLVMLAGLLAAEARRAAPVAVREPAS